MPRRIARLVLVLVGVLVGVLLSEGLVRLFAPQPLVQIRPDIWMPVEGLGHQMAPHVDTIINTGERDVRLLTDARGNRIGPQGPPRGRRKILAVGDSFVEGLSVAYPDLVSTRLAELMDRRRSRPRSTVGRTREYAVVTAGVSGWDPGRYYRKTLAELAVDDYDLVLLFVFTDNDVVTHTGTWHPPRPNEGNPIRLPQGLDHREIVDALIHPAYARLRARSHLVVLLKGRLLNLWLRLGLSGYHFDTIYLTSHADSPRWAMTTGLIERAIAAAARSTARAMVVLIPPDFVVDKAMGRVHAAGQGADSELVDLDQPARLLGRKLRDAGILVLDPTRHFETLHEQGVELYGRVDRHLTPRGHDELARFILPAVVEQLSNGNAPAPAPTSDSR